MALTRKDYASNQEVRWCPGCGDYAILAAIQKALAQLDTLREETVFISGIGCSSRLPYYMNTYGVHSIHGRAPTIATGLKASRPELSVWVITGDGDGLSIGGNHLLHVMRRNVNLCIILFNNRIYGLTKGQYSPTSELGTRTKSTPAGSIDRPIRPLSVALAAEATFVARTLDSDPKHLQETLLRAAAHKGTSFVEVFQNCIIFNDGAFDSFAKKPVRSDRTLVVEDGKPMIFGANRDKGIRLKGLHPEVVTLGDGISESELLVHDENREDPTHAMMLDYMAYPDYPVPLGVLRAIQRPTYDELMADQIDQAQSRQGRGNLDALLRAGHTWKVTKEDLAHAKTDTE